MFCSSALFLVLPNILLVVFQQVLVLNLIQNFLEIHQSCPWNLPYPQKCLYPIEQQQLSRSISFQRRQTGTLPADHIVHVVHYVTLYCIYPLCEHMGNSLLWECYQQGETAQGCFWSRILMDLWSWQIWKSNDCFLHHPSIRRTHSENFLLHHTTMRPQYPQPRLAGVTKVFATLVACSPGIVQ